MERVHEGDVDYGLPQAKRQRTQSPSPSSLTGMINATSTPIPEAPVVSAAIMAGTTQQTTEPMIIPGLGALEEDNMNVQKTVEPESNGILDMLMQHVESASQSTTSRQKIETTSSMAETTNELSGVPPPHQDQAYQASEDHKVCAVETVHKSDRPHGESGVETTDQDPATMTGLEPAVPGSEVDARSPEAQAQIVQATGPEAAEWEADSSPLESSSDSETSDSSSSDDDSDEEIDGGYAMLGLEEQARILMQGDGGSDDEGGERKSGEKADRVHLRTTNEKLEEVIPKPDISLTNEKIEELGVVEGIVENTVLLKAKVSGEYQVLESGSLLCLENRTVVGVVAELFGRVEQPMYTIRFTNDAAIQEAGLSVPGTAVYYVEPPHSTFVFTQPLKSIKGSDASNFHDEEVGDEEMEFSDDEAEAEHKRRLKLKRQGRRDDRGERNANHNELKRPSASHAHDNNSPNVGSYHHGAMEMNYDDVDEGYTPLVRPSNLHMMAAPGGSLMEGRQHPPKMDGRGSNDRGKGKGRGRGRGFDRGRGRGSRPNIPSSNNPPQWNDRRAPEPAFNSAYPTATTTFASSPPAPYHYQTHSQQYSQYPNGPPQVPAYPPFSPSPISPLPGTQFNFNAQQPQHNSQLYGSQNSPTYHYGGSPHVQPHQQMPPPGSHINPAFLEALRKHQQQ